MTRLVVMGVSGSGKSTVGAALAERLGLLFVDADSLHSEASVAKMAAGHPLDDADRWPWLARVAEVIAASDHGVVVACSALKRSYRDALRAGAPGVRFVYLEGSREVLQRRLRARPGHFMPVSLLDSQLAALEPLEPDERGVTISIDEPLEKIIAVAASEADV